MLNRKSLQGNAVVDKLDSLIELTLLHLESCQSSGRLAEVFLSLYISTHPDIAYVCSMYDLGIYIIFICSLNSLIRYSMFY